MNLPIEFTTTLKPDKLTIFYRKARMKQTLVLMATIIPVTLLALYLFNSQEGSDFPWQAYLLPVIMIAVLWLAMSYFITGFLVKKQFEANPSLGSVRAYVLNLDTISHFSELDNGEFSWKLVAATTVSDQLISITMKNGSAHLIDPADLDTGQLRDAKALLVEKGLLK
ncbi:hypothetical protein CEQ90_14690 [Lewinellaceae bacterium SD302]|nr:hypothetical protein CEQ90_14690 [Lewinellaceae bacterium SD302]